MICLRFPARTTAALRAGRIFDTPSLIGNCLAPCGSQLVPTEKKQVVKSRELISSTRFRRKERISYANSGQRNEAPQRRCERPRMPQHSLNTKLTATEAAAVDAAADSEGKAVGEWLRDLVLRELADGTQSIAISGDYGRNCGTPAVCSSTHLNRFCAATR